MRRLPLLVLALLTAGCLEGGDAPGGEGRTTTTTTPTPAGDPEPLSTRTLDRGAFSGVREQTRALLRGQAEFEA
ncbi:MAG TPA: hypothetical protein VNX21_02680, partial [Candidatus Thermoplasmatota archaeon]|nr:hypothetical protein [Candidatus Thermoplasmatota archaeon]